MERCALPPISEGPVKGLNKCKAGRRQVRGRGWSGAVCTAPISEGPVKGLNKCKAGRRQVRGRGWSGAVCTAPYL